MTGKQLERRLAELSLRSVDEMDVIGREMRAHGLSPKGGRGRHAPELDDRHVANFLIGLAGSARAHGAAEAVHRLSPLAPVGGFSGSFWAAETFGDALEAMAGDEGAASAVRRVRMCHTRPAAEIEYRIAGEPRVARHLGEGEGEAPFAFSVWGEIGGGLIHQLWIDRYFNELQGDAVQIP